MDKTFKRDVGPLVLDDAGITLGAGDRIGYFWTDAQFGAEFLCLNGAHLTYANTLKLIDWLIAATGGEVPVVTAARFHAVVIEENKIQVWDEDFGYDASLKIIGDFGTHAERLVYAEAVAVALNAAVIPTAPQVGDGKP